MAHLPSVKPTYVFIGPEDYVKYPAPKWARLSNPLEAMYVAKQKVRETIDVPIDGPFDGLLMNAWEFAVAFRSVAERLPTAMIIDAVPDTVEAAANRQKEGTLKRWIAHSLNQYSFSKAVPYLDYFLVKSSVCAESLKRDFGVPPERCFVTLAPQDLNVWKPRNGNSHRTETPTRLLFVGNDLARKGGDFLLDVYKDKLTSNCTLTIVSTDSKLAGLPQCEGVKRIPGISREQLVGIFQDSDIFVFPTRQDYTPEVVAEALAVGLPCLVGDVDGAKDLIKHERNGFLVPRSGNAELWASYVHRLSDDRDELARMSACARRFAEESLSLDRFNALVADVIGRFAAGKVKSW